MSKKKSRKKVAPQAQERSYQEIIASAGSDWITSGISMDAEVFQNVFAGLGAMRDAWAFNPYFGKYREQLASSIFGEAGIMLRSKIKETEDRVVNTPDEKWALIAHERKINRLLEWAAQKRGTPLTKEQQYRAFHLAEALERSKPEHVIRGTATVQVGAPDVYANTRVEAWWKELQRAEYIDFRGRRNYDSLRHLRLWCAARDGEHFIRMIKDVKVNRMGFTLQHISAEWVDHFYNETLESGNVVRMGIEYAMTPWGIGRPVAFHFIRRQPRDWQTGRRYGGNGPSYKLRDRVPADEIIHYARFLDTEQTRPAPWGLSALGKLRQLDQYEVANVIAARREACSVGYLESTVNPEGGMAGQNPDPRTGVPTQQITPGGLYGLPWGVTYKQSAVNFPNGNFQNFREGMGQASCAGLPAADYNIIFNDLKNISFSSGRLGRLDRTQICKLLLSSFDIPVAERPIFENGLEMALITGAIPLPINKFFKFNKPAFYGPGFEQVDEVKAVNAAALRIANKLSNRTIECAALGGDFNDNAAQLAEEEMTLEMYGLRQETTAQEPLPPEQEDDDEGEDPKSVVENTNGTNGANGKHAIDLTKRLALIP